VCFGPIHPGYGNSFAVESINISGVRAALGRDERIGEEERQIAIASHSS